MNISYNAAQLTIDGTEIELPAPISVVLEREDYVIVQLDTLGKESSLDADTYRQNIWRIEPDGTIRWKVVAAEPIEGESAPYTDVWETDNSVWAYNWNGIAYELDPASGDHRDSRLMK